MVRLTTQVRHLIRLFGQVDLKPFMSVGQQLNWVLIQQFYIIMTEYVVLALHFRILKLIMVMICKKVASKGIKSLLEKLI